MIKVIHFYKTVRKVAMNIIKMYLNNVLYGKGMHTIETSDYERVQDVEKSNWFSFGVRFESLYVLA